VTLYEMLTGVLPFPGETPRAVLARVLTGEPTSVEEYRSDVPAGISALVERTLEKDPA
ncbi:MAG: serine/threonine protein kinase, partial [Gemmatimonadetes bacterium]|nr:serine/threonine protein kinase [Gemmatimonadota bacterium]NIQ52797.1 serine/threonine protein kinase [Gemmatimonadota bacterium]NIU72927.1 serine/threonine protein kinase [Gammaproteobacteria bacterium]NIX23322.1 serine/threonine protein kinase [Actinomycetota bacterium]NIX43286.1 serine/threonine protein kinase [Gemmatimonadota bacterium]